VGKTWTNQRFLAAPKIKVYKTKRNNLLKSVVPKREKLLEAVESVQLFNPENRIRF
jgi:hypothetical protein